MQDLFGVLSEQERRFANAHREAGERLREMVDQLPDVERRLVRMVYFEGKTLQDASNQMGISKSWASRLHSRILERLAGQLRRLDLHD